jgi:hypothetical protein
VIAGSDDFVCLHLATARGSREIPRSHLRPPRPALGEILGACEDGEALVTAYECGHPRLSRAACTDHDLTPVAQITT